MAAVRGALSLLITPCLTGAARISNSALGHQPLSRVHPGTSFQTVSRQLLDDDGIPRRGAVQSGKFKADDERPKPTNAWWENLVLAKDPGADEANIFQMPYVMIADTDHLKVMAPFVDPNSGVQAWIRDQALELSWTALDASGPVVQNWDDLSLTLAWDLGQGSSVVAPIVRGSPYATAEYVDAAPRVFSDQLLAPGGFFVVGQDGESREVSCDGGTISGSAFSIQFIQSDSTWLLFAPSPMEWVCTQNPFEMKAVEPITGAVRVAMANGCTTGASPLTCANHGEKHDASGYTKLLIDHAAAFPQAAEVDFRVSGDEAVVSWNYKVERVGRSDAALLQLAWPVHVPLLSADVREEVTSGASAPFHDLRGTPLPIVGNRWELTYKLFQDVGFKAPRPVKEEFKDDIVNALSSTSAMWKGNEPDSNFDLPDNFKVGAGDTYFSGKLLARLARTIVIADEVGLSRERLFNDMVDRLAKRIEVWLGQRSENPFLYDKSWGGLVSCGCNYDDSGGMPICSNEVSETECPALSDPNANFGNGFYNDHHFHYGYFVYAAAVAAKYKPAWEDKFRQELLMIIRDYANPSWSDPNFPVVRHMDWFLGFSWAGGIPEATRNGRNQESTSEAVNAYYALYLYGSVVSAASSLKDLGRLLTAMETHGAQTFWQLGEGSVSNPAYKHDTVGILWDHSLQFTTFFGAQRYFVRGIQRIPYTPVNEYFMSPDWVARSFHAFKESCDDGCATAGWSWIVCMDQAFFDVQKALDCVQALPKDAFAPENAGSGGQSLTNSLYWIATRGEPLTLPEPDHTAEPALQPSSNSSAWHIAPCTVGENVECPGGGRCEGNQCCVDGSACPSADPGFNGCGKEKLFDCTSAGHIAPCTVGENVECPGGGRCEGNQCCVDGSTCPSADPSFTGCGKEKVADCTRR